MMDIRNTAVPVSAEVVLCLDGEDQETPSSSPHQQVGITVHQTCDLSIPVHQQFLRTGIAAYYIRTS